MALTVSPSVDAEGNYTGSSIEQHSEGLWKGDQGYIQLDNGDYTNAFADVEIEEDDSSAFQEDSYVDALVESVGGRAQYNAMTEWAYQTQSPDVIEWFNSCIDSDDLNQLNQAIEWLANQYAEANAEALAEASVTSEEESLEDTDPTDVDEWFETISDEVIDAELDTLLTYEFGEQEAEQLESAAQYFDANTTEASVIMYGIAVANGQVSIEDAIQQVTDSYGESEAYRAYLALQQYLT
jgi:hypothetical protein